MQLQSCYAPRVKPLYIYDFMPQPQPQAQVRLVLWRAAVAKRNSLQLLAATVVESYTPVGRGRRGGGEERAIFVPR